MLPGSKSAVEDVQEKFRRMADVQKYKRQGAMSVEDFNARIEKVANRVPTLGNTEKQIVKIE